MVTRRRYGWLVFLMACMLAWLGVSGASADEGDQKVWLVVGDSISEHNSHTEYNYDEYVSEMLDLKVVNVAVGGTGYLKDYRDAGPWDSYVQDWPEDVDVITVMGGLNDSGFTLGEFNDEDIDTFYGALRQFYEDLINQYPCTPIGVITSPPRANSWGEDGPDVSIIDAILRVAENYSLPVLDLYRCSGLRPWNTLNNREYFSNQKYPDGDGIHPNAKGQKVIASKVAVFMEDYLLVQ